MFCQPCGNGDHHLCTMATWCECDCGGPDDAGLPDIDPMEDLSMPGPVSDSYDPEFGTGDNSDAVRRALEAMLVHLDVSLGNAPRKDIVQVARGEPGRYGDVMLSERDLRLIRFCIHQQIDSM